MYDTEIKNAAEKYHVDEGTIRGIIQTESGFNPSYVGTNGAQGLMGLQKNTAKALGIRNPLDAAANIDAGVKYFAILRDNSNGDEKRALQKFNSTTLDADTYMQTVTVNAGAGISPSTGDGTGTADTAAKDKTNFIGDIVVVLLCILLFVMAFICLLKSLDIKVTSPAKILKKKGD